MSSFSRAFLAVFGLLLVPGAWFLAPGASRPAAAGPTSVVSYALAQAEAGQAEYEERCASCHGDRGQGTDQGPPIVGLGPAVYDFMMSTGRMPLDQPADQATRRRPVLSPDQIEEITSYLLSLGDGGIPIPQVHPELGSLSLGQRIYELDCAPCHGATANGGAVGTRAAPNLHEATPVQVAEAVRIGPTSMPVFGPGTLSDEELDSLVRYVLYLRHPDDRGGASLNRAGPLIEGFVALLIGLGVMLVLTRFIGERS